MAKGWWQVADHTQQGLLWHLAQLHQHTEQRYMKRQRKKEACKRSHCSENWNHTACKAAAEGKGLFTSHPNLHPIFKDRRWQVFWRLPGVRRRQMRSHLPFLSNQGVMTTWACNTGEERSMDNYNSLMSHMVAQAGPFPCLSCEISGDKTRAVFGGN